MEKKDKKTRKTLSKAMVFILLFGVVSLLSDMTHEGAASIQGSYLSIIGASAAAMGVLYDVSVEAMAIVSIVAGVSSIPFYLLSFAAERRDIEKKRVGKTIDAKRSLSFFYISGSFEESQIAVL